jgi:hypothetical protein
MSRYDASNEIVHYTGKELRDTGGVHCHDHTTRVVFADDLKKLRWFIDVIGKLFRYIGMQPATEHACSSNS